MATDLELHARLVGGDLTALGDLYDEHSPLVYGVALRVTGSEAQAEEITQDVFAALWRRPLSFDPGLGSLRGWLASKTLHESATRKVRH